MHDIFIDGMADDIWTQQGQSGIGEDGQAGQQQVSPFFPDQLQQFLQDPQGGSFFLFGAQILLRL